MLKIDVLKCLVKFPHETVWSMTLACWKFLVTASISLVETCLFRFSDSSWFSVGRLHVSRNLSILSWLSNFLAYSCLYYFLTPFVFFGMEKRDISCTIGELADWCSHGRKHYGVYIKQSKIKLLHDPAIPFLGIYAW